MPITPDLKPDPASSQPLPARLAEIFAAFAKLGLISFGGPIAHLGYFRTEFVARRNWIADPEFADLVALCQFLPGPASSQVVFALGMRRAGLLGGLLASLCFTLPSAALMIAFAYGVAHVGDLSHAGWLHGLKLAAVVVVAQAVWSMGRNLCPDRPRLCICFAAAALLLAAPGALVQLAVIAAGAALGWSLYRTELRHHTPISIDRPNAQSHALAALTLLLFLALLLILPALAAATHSETWSLFDSFYRSGSLVFGGGHVVLPLLRAEVVPRHWLTDDQFLAGYGAAQAVPGPLFSFAAYLGAAMHRQTQIPPWLNGLWCLLAIFLPAWLLIGGALPFWHTLRAKAWAQAALRGANAAVVGVLLAALYTPVFTEGVHSARDVAAALLAYALLAFWRVPPWAIVIALAIAGQFFL